MRCSGTLNSQMPLEIDMQKSKQHNISCPECELTVSLPELGHKQRAVCPRCGHTLTAFHRHSAQKVLAFSLTAFVFLLLSLPFNFLSFKASGQQHQINLPSGLQVLIDHDYISLAIITGLATLILPGLVLLGMMYLSATQLNSTPSNFARRVLFWVRLLLPWSMAEIFLVGTLVSLIKISSMADVSIGLSFYAFILFTLAMTVCLFLFDETQMTFWAFEGDMPTKHPLAQNDVTRSIQRTWALLITACLLYLPANLYPIMSTSLFGRTEPNTIFGGVVALWESGSYPIAFIIFFASIIVPIAKLVILAWLNYTVQTGDSSRPEARIKLYRVTEFIGRWSMIDVFVVAVLVALIQLGNTISIFPGPAALAFCAVVFITMIAAMTFDSRLLWYTKEVQDNHE